MYFVHKNLTLILLLFIPKIVFATCIGINCTCTIAASTFNLGTYAPLSGSATSGTGTVSVTCSALLAGLNVSYVISLNAGSSGTFTARTMQFSSYNLNYNIYTTAAHTTVWGDGTAGTGTISDSYNLALTSTTKNYTTYGLIPASQNVKPGTYSDSITATVTF